MPCYKPLTAYQCGDGAIVFTDNLKRHDVRKEIQLPCGQCIGCRLERSRVWAARCMHEAQMHEENAFITLTYNEENLPSRSLQHREWQLFVKRLRKSLLPARRAGLPATSSPLLGKKISYYMAGEYGAIHRRPHFHACIFGWSPNDKIYWRTTGSKSRLYTSLQLENLWRKGFTSVGDVNFESAAYIARYIIDKKTGPGAWKYYEHIDDATGEITNLLPEYNKMSLRPAIGKNWLDTYSNDAYPNGEILIRKRKTKTPKYYDKLYKKWEPELYEEMKMRREIQALEYRKDNTPERLKAKETVKAAQINALIRKL
ncbi:MAG: replication initiator protein [Microvirus sp.]|nr:MAG: replication initiator protein [Microvirus sp.]